MSREDGILHTVHINPVSPPTSVKSEDGATTLQLGFGWEFEYALEAQMRLKQHQEFARFQRYERFGMQREEARLPTPDHFRVAYEEFLEAIENDRSPSLSPSPGSPMVSTRDLRRVKAVQRRETKDATKKVQISSPCSDQNRVSKQTQARAIRPQCRKQKNHWRGSIHGMTTRSKLAALRASDEESSLNQEISRVRQTPAPQAFRPLYTRIHLFKRVAEYTRRDLPKYHRTSYA